jgi:quercetin dioxygenase-like cupin family protein
MKIIDFSQQYARPIEAFGSVAAYSVHIADGSGEAHAYSVYFEPGGMIGEHEAGFGQLFLVVGGKGWAAGGDGHRVEISAGQGVYFERGELHSKGSETGRAALMVQVTDLEPKAYGNHPIGSMTTK